MDKGRNLKEVKIYAANLVSSERWSMFFRSRGFNLTTIKLTWLDASFTDEQVADLVRFCPNVERLKVENCWLLSEESIDSIAELENLKHLSLKFIKQVPTENMIRLISAVGPKLETLSLRGFKDLDDEFLDAVHSSCTELTKLRISDNDTTTDAGWENLFTRWDNPPLEIVDLSGIRDVDNQQPDGPEEDPVGLAGAGFQALMAHCKEDLRRLDISGCRHIPLSDLAEVFQLGASFPRLQDVDFSFVQNVDDVVLAGLFKASAGALKKVALFGCFGITTDAIVPRGVVVVGAPRIGIEEEGMEVWGSTDMYEVQATKGKAIEMNGVMKGLKMDHDAMDID
jgi:DNA repair protein RAD7